MSENKESAPVKSTKNPVKKMDAAVMSWAGRFLVFFLLFLGIPGAGFVVYHAVLEGQQVEPVTLESLTEKGPYVCYDCGKPAAGYYYNSARPDGARIYFCKRHEHSKYNEIEDALIPHRRPMMYGLIGLVLVIGPVMIVKYRPRPLEIIPSDSSPSIGLPPGWFWLCVLFSTVLYPMVPAAFFIGLQGYRAYPRRSWRRVWGAIAVILSAAMIVLLTILVIAVLKEFR